MAATALVKDDIEAGLELIQLLDKARFPVTGAAWIYFSDIEEWRLVVRTPKAASDLHGAYSEVRKQMDAKGDLRRRLELSRIKLVPPTDKLLEAMGSAVRAEGLNTIRFGRNVINGIYIDDALIYRLAA